MARGGARGVSGPGRQTRRERDSAGGRDGRGRKQIRRDNEGETGTRGTERGDAASARGRPSPEEETGRKSPPKDGAELGSRVRARAYAAPRAGVGRVGCPRRGLLLFPALSTGCWGPHGGRTPASGRQSHCQGGRVPAPRAIHPARSWIQPFTSAFTFDVSGVIPRTGEMAPVVSSNGEEKGDMWWDPCSLPTCTTLQVTAKTGGDRGGSIVASLCHLVAIRKKDKSK